MSEQNGNSNDFQVYDEITARLNAAFEGFKRAYEVMNPPPVKPQDKNFKPTAKHFGMTLGLVGAVIVSVSHTVPIFLGVESISHVKIASIEFIIALAIFVMLEMGIISFGYSSTESEGTTDTAKKVRRFTRGGMWYVVTIAILANVYYVLSSNIEIPSEGVLAWIWEFARVVIFLLIGASAPVVAFINGDILAIDVLKQRSANRKAQEKYQSEYEEWYSSMLNSWNAQKKKWGGQVNVQINSVNHSLNSIDERHSLPHSVNHSMNGANEQGYSANVGYSKKMNARDIIKQWFEDNPKFVDSDDTVDSLHQRIIAETGQKVGRTSVYNVRKELN